MIRYTLLLFCGFACTEKEPIFPERAVLVQQNLNRFDPDGNGSISPSEFGALYIGHLRFEAYDENRDGQIDAAELDRQIALREPRPLMDLKQPMGEHPHVQPHGIVERSGQVP